MAKAAKCEPLTDSDEISSNQAIIKHKIDLLYERYNDPSYVHPDPLEFLYLFDNIEDRELVGIISTSLAYGRVAQILASISKVLSVMKPSPSVYLKQTNKAELDHRFSSFRHRFSDGKALCSMLIALKKIIEEFGSLQDCFLNDYSQSDINVIPSLAKFVDHIQNNAPDPLGHLVTHPNLKSACKRWFLFLRWMIRHDRVDPGGWDKISPSKLIVPLDTHMHRISTRLGFTSRKQANLATALEVTEAFKKFDKSDPVKYDFALTRLGIRNDINPEEWFAEIESKIDR